MRKAAFLLALSACILLMGCPAQPPSEENQTPHAGIRIIISPVKVVEEKETIVTGDSTITRPNGTPFINRTIPDYAYEPEKNLFVYFINVTYIKDWSANATNERQGEAILLKKGDADILIDAGPRQASQELVNFLLSRGVDDLELLVSTHPREENYGGMEAVFGNLTVEQFMWNGDSNNDPEYQSLIEKAGVLSGRVIQTNYLYSTEINGINLTVINPRDGADRFFHPDNDGIVLKIVDRDFCLMTTGDIAYGAQTRIADAKDFSPRCRVLQVPNYGLGQGSSQIDLFLVKVAPETAIITGSYFDPDNERYSIEEKLSLRGIAYYEAFQRNQTLNGQKINASVRTLRISTDGYNYTVAYN